MSTKYPPLEDNNKNVTNTLLLSPHANIRILYILWMRLDLLVDSLSFSVWESKQHLCTSRGFIHIISISCFFGAFEKPSRLHSHLYLFEKFNFPLVRAHTTQDVLSLRIFFSPPIERAGGWLLLFQMNCVYLNLVALTYPAQIKDKVVGIKN